MLLKKISVVLLAYTYACTASEPLQNGCEWWDQCLETSVSYQTFADWLGTVDAPSRVAMRQHVAKRGYTSILDVPCGLCIDFYGLQNEASPIAYYGVDYSHKLIQLAHNKNIRAQHGSIEQIPHADNSKAIVYCRHILEHLPGYEQAVTEAVRVAQQEVLIVFFIIPHEDDSDVIDYSVLNGHGLYHNRYSKEKFEQFVYRLSKVQSLEWQHINDNEIIAHIYLTSNDQS